MYAIIFARITTFFNCRDVFTLLFSKAVFVVKKKPVNVFRVIKETNVIVGHRFHIFERTSIQSFRGACFTGVNIYGIYYILLIIYILYIINNTGRIRRDIRRSGILFFEIFARFRIAIVSRVFFRYIRALDVFEHIPFHP